MAESRGLRGSVLEEMINMTNTVYRDNNLALIQKIPTPITPITIDKESRHITLAYFDRKVRLIISVLFRGYRCVLTPKNAGRILFPCRIFMNISMNS